jgi:hypothetical protein
MIGKMSGEMKKSSSWRVIYVSGWVVSLLGIAATIWDFRVDPSLSDVAFVRANGALVIMGLFATVIAKFLKQLQERVEQLEQRGDQPASNV